VNEKHFDMDHFGGPGIKVTARPAEGYTRGEVRVETYTNCEDGEVTVRILDADGKCVAEGNGTDAQMRIENARMWNGVKDPYLYTAQAVLTVDGKEVDCVETRFGVRDFATDPKTGFYLNGKKYPLHGVSRHQDRKGIGNALRRRCISRIWI
jgi:beta-galactosidase